VAADSDLEGAIPPGASVLVDTSATLAYLTGSERASRAATQFFDAFVATGRNGAALSMVTVGEILVRPFRSGPSAVATAEGFLRHFGELRLVEIGYQIAREAARIRAATGLRMPDALIIATATQTSIEILMTNDGGWRSVTGSVAPDLKLCVLDDFVS